MTTRYHSPHRATIRRLRITTLVALYIGVSAGIGLRADDSQIYVNKFPTDEAQTPNVLFSIDTSGSMAWSVPGDSNSESRMKAVKDALSGLIQDSTDLKAGLGRYHFKLGGPIVFPVVNLDKPVDFETLSVSTIDRSSDDAEESGGSVILDSNSLEMTQAKIGGGTLQEAQSSPESSSDDDETGDDETSELDSEDLDFGDTDSGIRFPNLDIPRNATIAHAEIVFQATGEASSSNTDVNIYAHDVADSPTFTEDGDDSVSGRSSNLTTASVVWSNLADVSAGDKFTSPNIRTVIQEIVNRDGWNASNALTLIFHAERGHHTPASFDHATYAKPLLRVQYVDGGTVLERRVQDDPRDAGEDSNGTLETGFRGFYLMRDETNFEVNSSHAGAIFHDADIPEDAVVQWADIRFTARYELDSSPADMEIFGITNPDLNFFSDGNKISTQPLTTAKSSWLAGAVEKDEEMFAPERGDYLYTPNLAPVIKKIRELSTFEPGKNLGFVFKDVDGDGVKSERHVCSFDGVEDGSNCPEEPSAAPTLRVVYGFPTDATTVEQQIGLRFNDVTVPQGATIDNAYLEFTVDSETTGPGTLTIEIENSTAPKTYSTTSGETVGGRSYGSSTTWTTDVWDTLGEKKQSPDIAGLVSSVTSQSGWCGGGSLAFRITGSDARHIAEAYDKGGSGAPKLKIKYNTDNLDAGEGCTTKSAINYITQTYNDVEEQVSGGSDQGAISFNSQDLDIRPETLVGLRFEDVQIPNGAEITSTNLYLTSNDTTNDEGNIDIVIEAQQHDNAPPFTGADYDVSNRITGTPSVTWSTSTTWEPNRTYSPQDDGVDLTPLIDDIINDEDWAAGNAMLFTLQGANTSDDRNVEPCCQGISAARLEVIYETHVGTTTLADETGGEAIQAIIDDLVPSGSTPTVDALYESAAYFSSDEVHYGRTRGGGQSYQQSGSTNDSNLDNQLTGWHWDNTQGQWVNDTVTDQYLLQEGELSRLSHPSTYTPQANIMLEDTSDGSLVQDLFGFCQFFPNDTDCRTEHISNASTVTYISPFESAEECEKGYLVVLSDGEANHNSSRELIQSLTGQASCSLGIPLVDESTGEADLNGDGSFKLRDPRQAEQCGLEVADYLQAADFIDGTSDEEIENNVRTYTIGFNLATDANDSEKRAVEFLKALAFVGAGGDLDDPEGVEGVEYGDGFYSANTAEQLETVFEVIVGDIIEETATFVAPGISINAVNRLYHLNDIYYSLFRPTDRAAWLGNLKKFELCGKDQEGCEFGEVIDKNGDPAVHTDNPDSPDYGTLKPSALGFWSATDDNAQEINQGGAGERIPPFRNRTVYVNQSDEDIEPPADFTGNPWEIGTSVDPIDLDTDVDGEGTEDDPETFTGLKDALSSSGNCSTGDFEDQNACLNDLIEWMTGRGFFGDTPRYGVEPDTEEWDRWAFADPMHSRPLILTYGIDPGTEEGPEDDTALSKIFVGTNDGGLRMINDGDGVEEWIFFPNSMLGMQSNLKENPVQTHDYGIDGTPTVRIKDANGDSVIEPSAGDFVHLYFGLRRGGQQIFALNVTPESTVDGVEDDGDLIGEKNLIEPKILWRIDDTDPEFSRLAQTWSNPVPTRIQGNDGSRTVLIFGGGYHPGGANSPEDGTDENTVTPDGGDNYMSSEGDEEGNAIYIVDANTGERLWWASSSNDGNSEAPDEPVSAMNTSIAAPVTLVDSNEDGHTDRIYAVDLRGQVFRVDIAADPGAGENESELGNSSVGVLASLGPVEGDIPDGEEAPNEDRRKFLYAPEFARVHDTAVVRAPYDSISIISGNRAQPQGKTVLDRAYTIRDYLIENPTELTTSNYPACKPDTTCTISGPLDHGDLTNVTETSAFVIRDIDEDSGTISLLNSEGETASESEDSAVDELRNSFGWHLILEGENAALDPDPDSEEDPEYPTTGEKGFSTATVLDGKMFFTTYLPPEEALSTDPCSAAGVLGTSRFYAVDVFTGAPAFDRNSDTQFDKVERYKKTGSGPSSEVTVVNTPDGTMLQVPTRQGSTGEDPGFVPEFNKTFWLEE